MKFSDFYTVAFIWKKKEEWLVRGFFIFDMVFEKSVVAKVGTRRFQIFLFDLNDLSFKSASLQIVIFMNVLFNLLPLFLV